MPCIKVCGITDAKFAAYAAERQVDYLGLIFAETSPRCVTPDKARAIVDEVRRRDCRDSRHHAPRFCGVFTTQSAGEIALVASSTGLNTIQLHGPYGDDDVVALKAKGYEVWKLYQGNPAHEDAVLLDGRRGNTSGMADWSLVKELKASGLRVVLAGGISSSNVADAIRTGADVIDVSGSLETSPGIKSPALLDAFIAAFAASRSLETP